MQAKICYALSTVYSQNFIYCDQSMQSKLYYAQSMQSKLYIVYCAQSMQSKLHIVYCARSMQSKLYIVYCAQRILQKTCFISLIKSKSALCRWECIIRKSDLLLDESVEFIINFRFKILLFNELKEKA